MSEVVVRMEKVPKNCDDSCWGYLSGECPWSDHVDGYTMNGGRPRNCPIKGVLVLCGKCYYKDEKRIMDEDALWCRKHHMYVTADWFCADGDRK